MQNYDNKDLNKGTKEDSPAMLAARRNKRLRALYGVLAAALLVAIVGFAFHWSRDRALTAFAEHTLEYGPRKGVPRTIDELKHAIAQYEDLQKRYVEAAAQTAVYWRILAVRFQDKGMYLDAIDALHHAIDITSDAPTLHYLLGLNAAQYAKACYDGPGKESAEMKRYYGLAVDAFERAIALEPSYTKARYALSSLFVFELDRPADAIPHLKRYLENNSRDFNAMVLLARAFYMTGNNQEAADWYGKAAAATRNAEDKAAALANQQQILGATHGQR